MGSDPVKVGLVDNLKRPGGNITGVTQMGGLLGPKRLEVLREMVPNLSHVALLLNPNSGGDLETQATALQRAARDFGIKASLFYANTDQRLDMAFLSMIKQGIDGLVVSADGFFNSRSRRIAELALHHSIPAIYQYPRFVEAGGLASYGGSLTTAYRELGNYTGRILQGAKPGDLPVRRAAKIDLMINVKTAKTLGLTVAPPLLGRADALIR